jgi:hypothetical protein
MAFPLAIPFAISAIQSLIKFRGRLDTILSLNKTAADLPFALPPAPVDQAPHITPMLDFFRTPQGTAILELRGQRPDFEIVAADPTSPAVEGPRDRLLELYFNAADVRPTRLGPPSPEFAHVGPSTEMRLAYFIVESHRLSRNPAVTRVLLAAADTLMEVAGANANLFISDPRTRGLVETLLNEFAGERDWDDASGGHIFKTLLGSAAVAVVEHRGEFDSKPAVKALLEALADVRKEMDAAAVNSGTDFVAGFISFDGFQRLFSSFLTHAADTPELLPDNPALRGSIVAMLRETAKHPLSTLKDPKILGNILQAGLVEATAAFVDLADQKLGGQPLLAAVLKSVADAVQAAAKDRVLFRQIASGEMLTTLFQASLRTIASNPKLLTDAVGMNDFVANLVTAFADELSRKSITDLIKADTLKGLAIRGIEVLAAEPEFIAGNNKFAAKVLAATLEASAAAFKDGFHGEDFVTLAQAAVRSVVNNASLIEMDERLRDVIVSFGTVFSEASIDRLTSRNGRKDLFLAALETIAVNPKMWNGLAQKNLVQPLVLAVLRGLASDPTKLLTGPALVPVFRELLLAAARRGQQLVDDKVNPEVVRLLLETALTRANTAIGQSIDGETLPTFLRRVVDQFLKAPIDLANNDAVNAWFEPLLADTLPV